MQWYYQAVASRVGVRLQANQIKGDRRLGSKAAARRSPAPRRSEARCCISWRKTRARSRRGRRKSDEREHPAKITASVSIAKGMAQKALAASPNPQWTECEMQFRPSGRETESFRSHPPLGRVRAEGEKVSKAMGTAIKVPTIAETREPESARQPEPTRLSRLAGAKPKQ